MYFKAENMDRTQEVWTWFTTINFGEYRISKYHQKGHMPLHISFYINKCFWRNEEVVCYIPPFQLSSYPLSFPQYALVHTAFKQGYDITALFFCFNNFVLLLCFQLILKIWLLTPQEFNKGLSCCKEADSNIKRQNFFMWSASGLLNKAISKSL